MNTAWDPLQRAEGGEEWRGLRPDGHPVRDLLMVAIDLQDFKFTLAG